MFSNDLYSVTKFFVDEQIGVGMIGLQQFGGVSGVSSYMSNVFDSIGILQKLVFDCILML